MSAWSSQRAGSWICGITSTRTRVTCRSDPRTCPQPRDLLRCHRRMGHGSLARGRRAHQCARSAQSRAASLSRRHHRATRALVWIRRLAVPTLRRPRHDPQLGRYVVESRRRRASTVDRSTIDRDALTQSFETARRHCVDCWVRQDRMMNGPASAAAITASDRGGLRGLTQFARCRPCRHP